MKKHWFLYIILITFISCQKAETLEINIPKHFPEAFYPEDNHPTFSRIELGKRLFFGPLLSVDSTVSCASCHHPNRAFSDTTRLSRGVNDSVGSRNSPSLMNVIYTPKLFRDGGVSTLEHQVISPLENPAEMNFQLHAAADRMSNNPYYQKLSQEAYGREMSPYVLVRALAAYERTLIGGHSRYDLFAFEHQMEQLTAAEQRGMELFFSDKTDCSKCHRGVLFTNFDYLNNGIYEEYTDVGRAGVTMRQQDKYKFKVPSLRNVALTAPYMHDGSIQTLEEVVTHYNKGGKSHPHQDALVRPLGLTIQEQSDLVAFLKSLTEK